MSNQELYTIVHDLKELKLMAEQLNQEIAQLENAIKQHMEDQAIDTIVTSDVKITWKSITSTRLDTTALKKALPQVAAQFTRETTSRRFCVQ